MTDDKGGGLLLADGPPIPPPPDELAGLLLGAVNLDGIPDALFERPQAERANADPAALAVVADWCEEHLDAHLAGQVRRLLAWVPRMDDGAFEPDDSGIFTPRQDMAGLAGFHFFRDRQPDPLRVYSMACPLPPGSTPATVVISIRKESARPSQPSNLHDVRATTLRLLPLVKWRVLLAFFGYSLRELLDRRGTEKGPDVHGWGEE